jgi:hypothetical protein
MIGCRRRGVLTLGGAFGVARASTDSFHSGDPRGRGPRSRGRGTWPFLTFDLADPGEQEACRVAQRLALLLLQSMASDGCSMRELARASGVDVATVKSVLEGTHGPRLETAVRLMVARRLPLSFLVSYPSVDLSAGVVRLPDQRAQDQPAQRSSSTE